MSYLDEVKLLGLLIGMILIHFALDDRFLKGPLLLLQEELLFPHMGNHV